jgi:feruloyl esterase
MLTILMAAAALGAPDASACERLAAARLPETTIVSAALVPAGDFTPPPLPNAPPGAPQARTLLVPESCRIVGRITPQINFEVWMPTTTWNGKFQAVGGGGFAGIIVYPALAAALSRGYATASTDTGHVGGNGAWALNRPDLITDFAYRAVHETTLKAKALVQSFYGNPPRQSYFVGCSTGGRQGLMEAQRFPADYDGIVVGAPANYWTNLMVGTLGTAAVTLKSPASALPREKFPLIHNAALAACDAQDGAKDGLLEDPRLCRFDPAVLQCRDTQSEACLSPAEVASARRVYEPVRNPRTGAEIFPGLALGTDYAALAGGPAPFSIPGEFMKYFLFNDPSWDWKTFDFDRDVEALNAKYGAMFNAIDPNLGAFKKRGGRIVMYHGWSDQLIPAENSINYYASVAKTMGQKETDEFLRLFLAPGMAHCAGGPGPNTFDALGALEQWVEKGVAPSSLAASHRNAAGTVDRTRPLCPYPQVAAYKGTGSIDEAASFVCRDARR